MTEDPQEIIMRLRAMIPSFDCLPGCHDCCGPHPWSEWEWEHVPVKRPAAELTCPYVTPGGCEVYKHRPIVCRLFGTIAALPCPHGRRPLAMLSSIQEGEIMRTYLELIKREEEHARLAKHRSTRAANKPCPNSDDLFSQ